MAFCDFYLFTFSVIIFIASIFMMVYGALGTIKEKDFLELREINYQACLKEQGCIQECVQDQCRFIGCDIFYCTKPRNPYDYALPILTVGSVMSLFYIIITLAFCYDIIKTEYKSIKFKQKLKRYRKQQEKEKQQQEQMQENKQIQEIQLTYQV